MITAATTPNAWLMDDSRIGMVATRFAPLLLTEAIAALQLMSAIRQVLHHKKQNRFTIWLDPNLKPEIVSGIIRYINGISVSESSAGATMRFQQSLLNRQ